MRDVLAGVGLGVAALVLWLSVGALAQGAPECTCRYAGQVLNNTSWNFTGTACPMASAPDRRPAARSRWAGPKLAAATE